jgi:hypothetical protein
MLPEGGRKLSQRARAFHHARKHGPGVTAQPLLRLLELALQAGRRNLLQHGGPHRLWQDRLIEEGLPDGVEALQGGPQHAPMAFDRLVQGAVSAPIRGGDQLVVHLYERIEGLVGRLPQEADQHGIPLGSLAEAEAPGTRLRRVPGEGFLQMVVAPRQVEGGPTRGLAAVQLGRQAAHRMGCRQARWGLEDVEW